LRNTTRYHGKVDALESLCVLIVFDRGDMGRLVANRPIGLRTNNAWNCTWLLVEWRDGGGFELGGEDTVKSERLKRWIKEVGKEW